MISESGPHQSRIGSSLVSTLISLERTTNSANHLSSASFTFAVPAGTAVAANPAPQLLRALSAGRLFAWRSSERSDDECLLMHMRPTISGVPLEDEQIEAPVLVFPESILP